MIKILEIVANNKNSLPQLSQQPEGAEIKIAGVGSTPIAVSTQLPAAVAQLSQKGEFSFEFYL